MDREPLLIVRPQAATSDVILNIKAGDQMQSAVCCILALEKAAIFVLLQ